MLLSELRRFSQKVRQRDKLESTKSWTIGIQLQTQTQNQLRHAKSKVSTQVLNHSAQHTRFQPGRAASVASTGPLNRTWFENVQHNFKHEHRRSEPASVDGANWTQPAS